MSRLFFDGNEGIEPLGRADRFGQQGHPILVNMHESGADRELPTFSGLKGVGQLSGQEGRQKGGMMGQDPEIAVPSRGDQGSHLAVVEDTLGSDDG